MIRFEVRSSSSPVGVAPGPALSAVETLLSVGGDWAGPGLRLRLRLRLGEVGPWRASECRCSEFRPQ